MSARTAESRPAGEAYVSTGVLPPSPAVQEAVSDAEIEFTLMSIAKPFVFALVCAAVGPARARDCLGVNATGGPFNSVAAIERSPDGRTNPMVNNAAAVADRRDGGEAPGISYCTITPPS